MNILFLTMNTFTGIEMHNIYSELMKVYISQGHKPYIVTPRESRLNEDTELVDYGTYIILKVKIGNTSNVSMVEKGISTVTLNGKYRNAIKKYLGDVKFDLILYSTPPITLACTIKQLKSYYQCPTYLMLKDIFPQNAIDLGMIRKGGILHRYFRSQEIILYKYADIIGCMSQGNVEYVLEHNDYINPSKVEVCPNAIMPKCKPDKGKASVAIREKYNIPGNSVIFMYGGNLGKPQGIPFFIQILDILKNNNNCFFFICGSGSEYESLRKYIEENNPSYVILKNELPKEEYDTLLSGCDVGLLFLDYRFTIPNYPSRMLSYMEQSMPIAAFTDIVSDVGQTIVDGQFGWWSPSNNAEKAASMLAEITEDKSLIHQYGNSAREYLEQNFSASVPYNKISKLLGIPMI